MNGLCNLEPVIRNSLCIGCGACVAADSSIRLYLNQEKLMYEPNNVGSKAATSVCPSIRADIDWLHRQRFPNAKIKPLGAVESILLAQSINFERNIKASSGGIIKELLLEYLTRQKVDGAITLTHMRGVLFEPQIIRNSEEVEKLPDSIYHNVPFDNALRLLENSPGGYALVATPCQLEGIYNYIYTFRPNLADKIIVTIGLICGWTYTHHAIKAICEFKSLDYSEIREISYRGGGPVGNLRIRIDRKEIEIKRRKNFGYMVAFDRSFNIPRCHLCINHINYLADIVVGDAWLSRVGHTKTGVSIVICRSAEGVGAMQDLVRQGKVRCAEASEADLVESQSRNFIYGDFAYTYAKYLKSMGEYCPDMIGPNRCAAKLFAHWEVNHFHRDNKRKIILQLKRAYRYLWWRKAFFDAPRYFGRFCRKWVMRKRKTLLFPSHPKADVGPYGFC